MNRITRIVRAFFKALQMTLRGEQLQPPEQRYPNLYQWVQQGQQLVGTTFNIADQHGYDRATREQTTLTLNRRTISMQTILSAVRHNMTMEYPMLLDDRLEGHLTTLYAINIDDQYRVMQLAESDELSPPVRAAVRELARHLQAIPSSQQP